MILLYFLLYAAAGAHLYHYYPLLPEKLATHFGADGLPNGWMPRETFAYFYAGLFVFMTGVFTLTGALIGKIPDSLFNMPNKAYWFAPERRDETRKSFRRDCLFLGLFSGVFVIGLNHLLIGMALDGTQKLDLTEFFCWLGFYIGGILAFALRQLLRFRKPDDVK